jgi:hypothetical protein
LKRKGPEGGAEDGANKANGKKQKKDKKQKKRQQCSKSRAVHTSPPSALRPSI